MLSSVCEQRKWSFTEGKLTVWRILPSVHVLMLQVVFLSEVLLLDVVYYCLLCVTG